MLRAQNAHHKQINICGTCNGGVWLLANQLLLIPAVDTRHIIFVRCRRRKGTRSAEGCTLGASKQVQPGMVVVTGSPK